MGAGPTILTGVGSTLVHIQVASPACEASETGTGVRGIARDAVINALATIEAWTQDQAHRGCMAAAPHAHLGIIDSKRPAAGHAHVGGGLHLSHVCCARPGDVEVAVPITCVETCLGCNASQAISVTPAAGVCAGSPQDGLIVEDGEGESAIGDEYSLECVNGGRAAASKEGHTVPGRNKNPGSREVRELRKVPSDVLRGSVQHGWVGGLPVVDITCTPVVYICPEGCYHTAVFGDGEGHGGELRNFLQEGDDPIIVHMVEHGEIELVANEELHPC